MKRECLLFILFFLNSAMAKPDSKSPTFFEIPKDEVQIYFCQFHYQEICAIFEKSFQTFRLSQLANGKRVAPKPLREGDFKERLKQLENLYFGSLSQSPTQANCDQPIRIARVRFGKREFAGSICFSHLSPQQQKEYLALTQ